MKVKALTSFHASETLSGGRSAPSRYFKCGDEYIMGEELGRILQAAGQVEILSSEEKEAAPDLENKEMVPTESTKGEKPKTVKARGRR